MVHAALRCNSSLTVFVLLLIAQSLSGALSVQEWQHMEDMPTSSSTANDASVKIARGLKSSEGETDLFVPRPKASIDIPSIDIPSPNSTDPDSPLWNNSAAVCVCMRDETVADVREWLQYYRWLGFDHVLLTENNSINPIEEHIRDFIDSGFVTYRTEAEGHAQLTIYSWCIREQRDRFNWIAFFDADEFLVIRSGEPLKQLLDGFKHTPGIGVHMIRVGSNGHADRPAAGVLRSYVRCSLKVAPSSKTIGNTFFLSATSGSPHVFHYRNNDGPMDENMSPYPVRPGAAVALPTHSHPTVNRLALYHYSVKSWSDFETKMKRGSGGPKGKDRQYFDRINELANSDDPICREPSLLADQCCSTS